MYEQRKLENYTTKRARESSKLGTPMRERAIMAIAATSLIQNT